MAERRPAIEEWLKARGIDSRSLPKTLGALVSLLDETAAYFAPAPIATAIAGETRYRFRHKESGKRGTPYDYQTPEGITRSLKCDRDRGVTDAELAEHEVVTLQLVEVGIKQASDYLPPLPPPKPRPAPVAVTEPATIAVGYLLEID